MGMPILQVPKFPDVPIIKGVPALVRKAQPVLDAVGYVSHIDNVIERLIGGSANETWGVFDASGNAAITPETFASVSYKKEYRVMDYPIEKGAFDSFNKVARPYESSITMATGGTIDDRNALLTAVENVVESLDLYTIVTPERTYSNANMERFDYRREQSNGAHQIIVTLFFKEIRQTAIVNASDTLAPDAVQNPASADPQSVGQVVASKLTSAKQAAIAGAARVLSSVKSAVSSTITQTQTALDGIIP